MFIHTYIALSGVQYSKLTTLINQPKVDNLKALYKCLWTSPSSKISILKPEYLHIITTIAGQARRLAKSHQEIFGCVGLVSQLILCLLKTEISQENRSLSVL